MIILGGSNPKFVEVNFSRQKSGALWERMFARAGLHSFYPVRLKVYRHTFELKRKERVIFDNAEE